jgi:hypothetical protein
MLVPGKDERETFDTLLSLRTESLGIRKTNHEILVHPRRDPGCLHGAPDVLQPYQNRAHHALVVLDHEGSGQENLPADEVAADLKGRMERSGWSTRVEVLVLQPELEMWVWSDSPHIDSVMGWEGKNPSLRKWLLDNGSWPAGSAKPNRPKECFQSALRTTRIIRSSSLYRQLAASVGLERCQDPGFLTFRRIVQAWFPKK